MRPTSHWHLLIATTLLALSLFWALVVPTAIQAEVVRVDVSRREVVPDSQKHGRSGPYEVIEGIIHLEGAPLYELVLAHSSSLARASMAGRNSGSASCHTLSAVFRCSSALGPCPIS